MPTGRESCLCQAAARGGSVWARREREGTATLIRPRLPQGCRRKMAAVQSMRCDFGLRFSLRAILMLLSIEWTRGCMPRATQWRLEISQEYNSWEAYVYEFIAYEGTQGLNLTYSGDNCTRPGYETSTSGALAFDGVSSTSWQTCVYKIGGWVSFNLAAPAAVTNLCANQYDGGHGNTVKAFHVQYWVNGNWVLAWDTGAVVATRLSVASPFAACATAPSFGSWQPVRRNLHRRIGWPLRRRRPGRRVHCLPVRHRLRRLRRAPQHRA